MDFDRRTRGASSTFMLHIHQSLTIFQARYFKSMLKEADHLDKVKRQRVSEKDLAPLLPHYEVRFFFLEVLMM
jgi:hypothetical protein